MESKRFSFNGEIVELSIIGFICPVCLSVVKYSCRITPVGPDFAGSGIAAMKVFRVWRATDGKRGVDTLVPTLMMSHDLKGTLIKKNHEVIISIGDELTYMKLKPTVKVPANHPMLVAKIYDGRFNTWIYRQAKTEFVFKPEGYRYNPNPCKHCWYVAGEDGSADWNLAPITYPDFTGALGIETGDGLMYEMIYDQGKKNWFITHTFDADESSRLDKPELKASIPLDSNDHEVAFAGYIIIDDDNDEIDFTRSCLCAPATTETVVEPIPDISDETSVAIAA